MNDEEFQKIVDFANEPENIERINKDFMMRSEFEEFIRVFHEKYDFDYEGIYQVFKLMSHWVMFMHDKNEWKEQIKKIEDALNFLH